MSVSNNKKSNGIFKFLVIYTIIVILVTVGLVYFYKVKGQSILEYFGILKDNDTISKENSVDVDNYLNDDNIKRTSFLDKYYANNIKIENKSITKGNIIGYDYQGEPIHKLTINYNEISGLKDKIIQDNINRKIKEKAESFIVDEEIYDNKVDRILIETYIYGNFADLLSIQLYKNVMYKDDGTIEQINKVSYKCLNFRLDTGKEIELSDIFTKDASIKNILSQVIYNDKAYKYVNYDNLAPDLDKIDYGKIENDVFNVVSQFNNENEHNFYFSETDLVVIIKDEVFVIEMKDYSNYINIFNIVNSQESLYDNGNKEKIAFCFRNQLF